uniref:Putative secreted protein n=1 Tax=Anopheles marajoara TaxID=58244 RepID=A0A2M4C6G9_9DIPT
MSASRWMLLHFTGFLVTAGDLCLCSKLFGSAPLLLPLVFRSRRSSGAFPSSPPPSPSSSSSSLSSVLFVSFGTVPRRGSAIVCEERDLAHDGEEFSLLLFRACGVCPPSMFAIQKRRAVSIQTSFTYRMHPNALHSTPYTVSYSFGMIPSTELSK